MMRRRRPGPPESPAGAHARSSEPASRFEPAPRAERRERRALTHVGGEVTRVGPPELTALLAEALDVPSSVGEGGEAQARDHVHGFHAYPARMHPTTARRLVAALTEPGDTVLDPFCGSGTVLVEAALLGRRALGSDLNPLAVRLARMKITTTNAAYREALAFQAAGVAELATERRKAKSGASRRYPPDDVATFDAHVLLELDGLRVGIEKVTEARIRSDLGIVLSSILVKVSRRAADTAARARPTRIAAGFPTRLFVKRTEELLRALAAIEPTLSAAPPRRVEEDDARTLRTFESGKVDLVLSSPPYAGVYDYLDHHAMRIRWLGLDERRFAEGEVGARRHLGKGAPQTAILRFRDETSAILSAISRVLRTEGRALLLVADGVISRRPVRIDDVLRELAPATGLEVVAVASQTRPHFHLATQSAFADAPRREHAVLLQKRQRPTDTRPRQR